MRQIARTRSEQGAEGAQEILLLARLVLRPPAPPGAPVQLGQLAVQVQVQLTSFVTSTDRGGQPTKAAPSTAQVVILADPCMQRTRRNTRRG